MSFKQKRLDPMVGTEPTPIEDPEEELERVAADFRKWFPNGLSAPGERSRDTVPAIEEDADGEV